MKEQRILSAAAPVWKGVVAIERVNGSPYCKVFSARTPDTGLIPAISCEVAYEAVKKYFGDWDRDSAYAYAELVGEHLQLYERASQKEFFLTTAQYD
jgi:hypothetical protein